MSCPRPARGRPWMHLYPHRRPNFFLLDNPWPALLRCVNYQLDPGCDTVLVSLYRLRHGEDI